MNNIKELIKIFDIFNTSQILKIKNHSQYRTFTDGILSIGIIAVIILGFSNQIIQTFQKNKIDYSTNIKYNVIPPLSNITIGPQHNFMMGVTITGINLTSSQRHFDVLAYTNYWDKQINQIVPRYLTLEPCTQRHWFVQNRQTDTQGPIDGALCLPLNKQLIISGQLQYNYYSIFKIVLVPCNSQNDRYYHQKMNSSCIYNQQFVRNHLITCSYTIYYINTIINPDQYNPLTYTVDVSSLLQVEYGRRVDILAQINGVQINTDVQILPFKSIQTINSGPISQFFETTDIIFYQDTFFTSFTVQKSKKSITYVRQVQKISTVFSYIGGLVGAILTLFIFLHSYTSFALQISISSQLFKDKDHDILQQENSQPNKNQNKFINPTNIFQYMKFNFYKLSKKFKKSFNWPKYCYMDTYIQEVNNQLDVCKLLRRIIFLQHCINFLFQDFQLSVLRTSLSKSPMFIKQTRQKLEDDFDPENQENKISSIILNTEKSDINVDQQNNEEKFPKKNIHFSNQILKQSKIQQFKNNFDFKQADYLREPDNKVRVIVKYSKKQSMNMLKVSAQKGDILSQRIMNKLKQRSTQLFIQENNQTNKQMIPVVFIKNEEQIENEV